MPDLAMPFDSTACAIPEALTVLGTGQVGQAFLALAFFLGRGRRRLLLHLLDKDRFEEPNYRTQVLLSEDVSGWLSQPKADYLAQVCSPWGWAVTAERTEIGWGWKKDRPQQKLAFLGFDNLDARRVGLEGGFEWLFECGVGTDFCRPRLNWHSLPSDRELAKQVFARPARAICPSSAGARLFGDAPGECGRVMFENIEASAPSLGLAAAAFAWAETTNYLSGDREACERSAYLWSPFLPISRNLLGAQEGSGPRD